MGGSLIDTNAFAQGGQGVLNAQQAQQNAFEQMLQRRSLSALQGVDPDNPDSIAAGMRASLGAGNVTQANALMNLSYQRMLNTSTSPLVQLEAQRELAAEQNQPSDQFDREKYGRLLTESGAALDDLISSPPDQAQAKADAWRAQLKKDNVDDAAIDSVLSDPTDLTNLKTHRALIAQEQQQFQLTGRPGFQGSAQTIERFSRAPMLQAALAANKLDVGPAISQAQANINPLYNTQVQAAYAGPIAYAGTAGERQAAGQYPALNAGEQYVYDRTGNVAGIRNAAGVLQSLEQRQTAAAQGVANVPTPPEGGRVAVAAPGERPSGVEPTAGFLPTATGTRGAIAGAAGAAVANVNQAVDFERIGAGAVVRKGNLDNLRQEAGEFTAGPQSPFWAHLGALAAEYNIPGVGPIPKDDPVAAQAAFNKMATTILGQQRAALGLPATDQSTSITQGATPNDTLTAKGIARVSGILEGNEDYLNAGYQAWTTWKNSGHGYETFQQFLPQWNKMFNPRIFQAQYMTPQEAAKVKATIPNYDAQVRAAKRLGYIG